VADRNPASAAGTAVIPARCAIYTRKSTEEGLDQDFNSLDAQREAAEAYIRSQKHQGWTLVPERYDDGGYSGGTLERPALQRLLADIDAGRVNCVVVYKVGRPRLGGLMTIEYTIPMRSSPDGDLAGEGSPRQVAPARIARMLALAHRFEGLVRSGVVRDYAELARIGHVTRARMTQIMNLLNLAADIQEYLLWLPAGEAIPERDLRQIAAEVRWDRQRILFRQQKEKPPRKTRRLA
jgi:hypothetical protein